jgi:hypothetical protein
MRDKRKAVAKRYAVTNSNFLEIAALNRSDDSSTFKIVFSLAFSLSCFVAASMTIAGRRAHAVFARARWSRLD